MAEMYQIQHYRPKPPRTDGALALQSFPRGVENRPQLRVVPKTEGLGVHTQSLVQEVQNIKHAEAERRQGRLSNAEPWYYLNGTGFFVHGQVDLFLKDIQEEVGKGRSFQDAVNFCSVKIREDIKGFEDEYLKQLAGLAWNIGWKDVNGVKKLYGIDYNGAVLQDITGRQEREGALYDAWFTDRPEDRKLGIESWLKQAPKGSKAILVSPKGWSGYEGFTYPQTQIYYVEIGEGDSLKSFTLRYDVPIEKNEALQQLLGVAVLPAQTERERIKNMLGSPIFIAPDGIPHGMATSARINSPEDVISLMEQVRDSGVAFSDEKFGDRTFDDMRAFVRDPQRFMNRHPEGKQLVETFQEYVSWEFSQGHTEEETRQGLEIALALVIVHLKGLYFGRSRKSGHAMSREIRNSHEQVHLSGGMFQGNINYSQELKDIQELPGCAGGSTTSSKVRMNLLGSSREAVSERTSPSGTIKDRCPDCGKEVVATVDEDCRIICPTKGCKYSQAVRDGTYVPEKENTQDGAQDKPAKKDAPKSEKGVQLKVADVKRKEERRERRGHEPQQKAA